MKKVFSWLKNIRPLKILTVVLAGSFLFFTQACNPVGANQPRTGGPNSEMYVPKGTGVTSPVEGGMNNFSDVDPRANAARVKAKSEALKENAQQNIIDQTGSVSGNTQRILGKKGENIEDLGENIQRSAQRTGEKVQGSTADFAKGTRQGLENIRENTTDAASDTLRNVQRSAEDAARGTQRNLEKAGQAVRDTVD